MYPLEVEEVIARLEGINEVVVYRSIHPVMGKVVKSVFIADVSIQQQVTDMPKTLNDKVNRKLL
ncbi:hypothetical protein [Metabacillus fastidiosus]|uniref:hypothetical protein n=1 Tax=Metabacillus fastidiosus TaxID=1458 RepID=UPI003D2B55CD